MLCFGPVGFCGAAGEDFDRLRLALLMGISMCRVRDRCRLAPVPIPLSADYFFDCFVSSLRKYSSTNCLITSAMFNPLDTQRSFRRRWLASGRSTVNRFMSIPCIIHGFKSPSSQFAFSIWKIALEHKSDESLIHRAEQSRVRFRRLGDFLPASLTKRPFLQLQLRS